MKNSANADVRNLMKRERIAYWEVALVLGIHEVTFTRWMRTELDVDKKFKILRAINTIIFKAMAVRQNKAITEEKPTELFLSALREMLSTRKAKLLDTSSEMLPEEGIGWKDDNYA